MSCCGGRRAAASAPFTTGSWVEFRYVGSRSMTVFGPVTRHHYRFAGPGARVAVDPRDARSLAGVPKLRRAPGEHPVASSG
jgi:hypothetical protein